MVDHFGPLALLFGRVELNKTIAPLVNTIAFKILQEGRHESNNSPKWLLQTSSNTGKNISFTLVNNSGFENLDELILKREGNDRIEIDFPSDEKSAGFYVSHILNGKDKGINEFSIYETNGKKKQLIVERKLTVEAKKEPLQTLLKYERSLKSTVHFITFQKFKRDYA